MAPRNEDMDGMETAGSPPSAPSLLEITDFDACLVRSVSCNRISTHIIYAYLRISMHTYLQATSI